MMYAGDMITVFLFNYRQIGANNKYCWVNWGNVQKMGICYDIIIPAGQNYVNRKGGAL